MSSSIFYIDPSLRSWHTAVRKIVYFGGNGIDGNLLVVAVYVLAGVAVAILHPALRARRATEPSRRERDAMGELPDPDDLHSAMPQQPSVELPSEADIHCSAETIFDLITDLNGQSRWLKKSSAFRGTDGPTENPAVLGTTYHEPGPLGVRHGQVTEYERPTKITFHQPMTIRFGLGVVDITLRYVLTSDEGATHVMRVPP